MIRTVAAFVVLSLTLCALPAYAAEEQNVAVSMPPALLKAESVSRPLILPILYASYVGLQAFDVYSTKRAIALGAHETNPLMSGVVGNTGAFVALQATVALGLIIAGERLWKTNRTAAIVLMVASNSVAAVVAARNARTLRQLR